MPHDRTVFFDPTGRRKVVVYGFGVLCAIVALIGIIALVRAVANPVGIPPLPESIEALNEDLPIAGEQPAAPPLPASRPAQVPAGPSQPSASHNHWISAAFYSDQSGREDSLRENADKITHLMPVWLHLAASGAELDFEGWDPTDTENLDVLKIAKQYDMQVLPVLNNASGSTFDPAPVHALLASPDDQEALIDQIRDWLLAQGLAGLNLDFENLQPADQVALPSFISHLAAVLHDAGLTLSLDVPVDETASPQLSALTSPADFVVLMAYDQHSGSSGGAGPIAAVDWTAKAVASALKVISREKLVLGMGSYGYDWCRGQETNEVTYAEAMHVARTHAPAGGAEKLLTLDPDSLNPHFDYEDEASGDIHHLWYLDAASLHNQCVVAKNAGLRGSALWEIGGEDPGVWSVMATDGPSLDAAQQSLRQIDLSGDVQYDGDGELLQVISQPRPGQRVETVDPATNLVTAETYTQLPWGSVVQRNGLHPGFVALTFDDGPNPTFTPQVLAELKQENVPATFFLIGENAADNPSIVHQIWDAGCEIGNHTFTHPNLSQVGDARETAELNATQRTIQSILGRSTLLFRAPYYVETTPEAKDIEFISTATDLGYITVGAGIDPNDWNPYVKTDTGGFVHNSALVIANSVLAQVRAGAGNTILMHDGGGDRSRTVEALKLIIPQLKKEGYRFVTVSQLADTTRDALMPPVASPERVLLGIYHADLVAGSWFNRFLATVLLVAMMIGVFRIVGITTLAVVAHRRNKRIVWPANYHPIVSVLIPAYNENAVICRSIHSLLQSTYKNMEIIVIDDGSTDGTASVVQREFRFVPSVRAIRQLNGGKASALNRGIDASSGEIIVSVDADTVFEPEAIAMLVRRFSDSTVGAVAGNIKVGNRGRLLTRMQATEYITSQNLDRLAYSLLGAVTLVPGAIGAFRRAAIEDVGGYQTDTLAEDFDLTCRIRQAGWTIQADEDAIAHTEAPEDIGAFFRQRKRWSFGTLQTLWKNRRILFHHGGYGWLGMPMRIWEFFFYSVAPILYLKGLVIVGFVAYGCISGLMAEGADHRFSDADRAVTEIVIWFAVLFTAEVIQAFIAVRMDREDPRLLRSLLLQRCYYRQLIYLTLWLAWFRAFTGAAPGWGVLRRRASVASRNPISVPDPTWTSVPPMIASGRLDSSGTTRLFP